MAAVFTLLTLALSVASDPLSTYSDPQANRRPYPFVLAPVITPNTPPHRIINDSYIVVLKPNVGVSGVFAHLESVQSTLAQDNLYSREGGLKRIFNMDGLQGYAGSFSESSVDVLRSNPDVDYIEKDQIFHTQDFDVQRNAPWGLARISHRDRLALSTFKRYEYDNNGGEGVNVYVIDTGIFVDHVEFEGRARWGATMPKNDVDEDGNGHGTHCAGTIASRKYGVAKKATVIAVKVLGSNGSGSTQDVAGGIEWAFNDAVAEKQKALAELKATGKTKHKGSVGNMSLGGGKSRVLDQAVNAAVKGGVHFAVAAGNDNRDACDSSPAGAESPVTVGASTLGDERAYFSNYGPCVDVFGPGLNILSTWNGPGDSATNTISGTSMASPHTAGLMAYLLSLYPSVSFNPPVGEKLEDDDILTFNNPTYLSLVKFAKATLPAWMTAFIPEASVAPIPIPDPSVLTPELMKKALIALSTQDALSDLPPQTINLLIYNNVTAISEANFWSSL